MTKKYTILVCLFFLTFTFFSCDEVREHDEISNDTITYKKEEPVPPEKQESKETQKTGSRSEAEKIKFSKPEKVFLKTFDTISFGNNFSNIKKSFPTIKGIRPEGGSDTLAAEGLTESVATLSLLERDANIEFNYKNDSLYSYFLSIEEPEYETAEKIFNTVHDRYTKIYGDCKKEQIEEENRYNKTCYWNANGRTAVITYNINEGIISWGFQADDQEQPIQ